MEIFTAEGFVALLQVIGIDLVLAGDNAIVIGLAAAGLPKEMRTKAILVGIIAATVLRIAFAAAATQLMAITGLLLAGGVLLLWVCWKMWRELRAGHEAAIDVGNVLLPAISAGACLALVAPALVRTLLDFETTGFAPLLARYAARDVLQGRTVHTSEGLTGCALGVGPDGALRLAQPQGEVQVRSAEVSVRPVATEPTRAA